MVSAMPVAPWVRPLVGVEVIPRGSLLVVRAPCASGAGRWSLSGGAVGTCPVQPWADWLLTSGRRVLAPDAITAMKFPRFSPFPVSPIRGFLWVWSWAGLVCHVVGLDQSKSVGAPDFPFRTRALLVVFLLRFWLPSWWGYCSVLCGRTLTCSWSRSLHVCIDGGAPLPIVWWGRGAAAVVHACVGVVPWGLTGCWGARGGCGSIPFWPVVGALGRVVSGLPVAALRWVAPSSRVVGSASLVATFLAGVVVCSASFALPLWVVLSSVLRRVAVPPVAVVSFLRPSWSVALVL